MIIELMVLFGVFVGCLLLGVPVFFAISLATASYAIAFYPVLLPVVYVQTLLQGLDNTAFAAIAFFFLVGCIMNAGGMSLRLLRLARALMGHLRGGLSHANIGASVVFAGVSGSAVADAAAVGSIMIPAMKRDGYGAPYAAAVTAASSTIGLLIPPSIPMVVFGLFSGAPVGDLFLAGVVPGLGMGLFLLATSALIARRRNYASHAWQGWPEVVTAFRNSVFALLLPVLVIGGLISGLATTVEIGAIAAVYAAFVSVVLYRELSWRGLWTVVTNAALDTSRILTIIAVSGGFIWIIANMGLSDALALWVGSLQLSSTALLGLIALILVIAGTALEPITLLIVIVPVLIPAALASGVDILQLGVVSVLSCAIGLVSPPVGILIYITASQSQSSAAAVVKELMPFLLALICLLALIVVCPQLSQWLPGLQ